MSSAKKADANGRNALASTGPRTALGKARSAANATKHGLRALSPVVAGLEDPAAWEAHRGATVESLAPEGYVEGVLAERVALALWRLGRVVRFESETTMSALEIVDDDVGTRRAGKFYKRRGIEAQLGDHPDDVRSRAAAMKRNAEALAFFERLPEDAPVPGVIAEAVAVAAARQIDAELDDLAFPELPSEADEAGWSNWTGWTKKLVLGVVSIIAAEKRIDPAALLADLVARADDDARGAAAVAGDVRAQIVRERRDRLLLDVERLERIQRYEAHLERGLYRALHELGRLQAGRVCHPSAVVPVAIDVVLAPPLGSFGETS